MLIQFQEYLTFENIYLWTNLGILPFWVLLITVPNSKLTQFFINSIILPLILSVTYIYILYQILLLEESIISYFKVYISLEDLYIIFSNEGFLLTFWLHFIALNIFIGSWISRDGVKYNIHRGLVSLPLILVYFTGPLGIVLYWMIRIFYAKRITFHD